jgi:hypothetical protein
MRAALGLTDPATILLDRLAMARQAGPRRSRPIRLPFMSRGLVQSSSVHRAAPAATPDGPPSRHHNPLPVRDDRIAKLNLDPEDRLEPRLLVGRLAADDAVEALVIGHGEPVQAELGGSFGQLVRRRGAVEKREIGVAMELGVGGHLDRR